MRERSPAGRRLPRAAVRAMVRATIRPALHPLVPLGAQRRWVDLAATVLPLPAGTRVRGGRLGGVPTDIVAHHDARRDQAVLYLHGGGYTVGSPRSHRALAAHLSYAAQATVHLIDYRLAPEHRFPAALDDAQDAYRALAEGGEQIALVGDSAGGGLALALVLRLRDAADPLPAALGLISPWLDLDLTGPSVAGNSGRDAMLRGSWLAAAAASYRGPGPGPAELRPLAADLSGLPPMHVQAGADELLVSDADALVDRAREVGVSVTYRRWPRLWHDSALFAGLLADADHAVTDLGAQLAEGWGARQPGGAIIGAGFGGIAMGHRDAPGRLPRLHDLRAGRRDRRRLAGQHLPGRGV